MVRIKIFRARAIPRDALLGKVDNQEKQNKINFHITYHPPERYQISGVHNSAIGKNYILRIFNFEVS